MISFVGVILNGTISDFEFYFKYYIKNSFFSKKRLTIALSCDIMYGM